MTGTGPLELLDVEGPAQQRRARYPGRRARLRHSPGQAAHRPLVRTRRARPRPDARGRLARPARHAPARATAAPAPTRSAYGLACLELEAGDSGVRSMVSVQGSLAMFAIWKFGSEEQKTHWLPRMAAGEAIGCFGLTEPDFGSNPAGMRTRAKRDGDDWVLNGTKMWITNGSVADVAVVWAQTDDEGDGKASAASWCRPTRRASPRPRSPRSCRCGPRSPPSSCWKTSGCPATRCCREATGLGGPLSLPERGPLRHHLRRARRGPRLPGDGDRLREDRARCSTGRWRRSS